MNSILIYLLENKEEQFTINHISKALNINYRIAHTQVKILEKENIIKIKKAGNSSLCSLTNEFSEKIFLAEYKRRTDLLKNQDFNQILNRYKKAKQSFILLLFGSYAKNKQTKNSDIDLLAITQNSKELEEITNLIPKKIHLTTVSYQEFLNMKNTNELNVGREAMKNNIILIGIEQYYRLINNDS
ncbi:MAG: nucleotidyltransferase domain-containing protein [Candidatus Woesearchaeota archaeon]